MLSLILGALLGQTLQGKIIGVTDGDTVKVMSDGVVHTIRMANIDAPETKGQPFGQQAKMQLSSKVFGKNVSVKLDGKDHYNRQIGTIMLENRNINLEMVEEGYAWCYRQYCRDGRFMTAETTARGARVGLWSMPQAIAPWEFRSEKKSSSSAVKPSSSSQKKPSGKKKK